MNTVMKLGVPYKAENFLPSWATITFLKTVSAP